MKSMRVQLIRKLANRLNGVDLTPYTVGEAIDLPERAAAIVLSEGWALPVRAALPLDDREGLGGPPDSPATPRASGPQR